jgi:hypothetical protein
MSEPFAERLSRFTPDAAGLDRDALLFAAGRASVRPNRRWQILAVVLAASQLLTLVSLWPRTPPPSLPAPLAESEPPAAAPAPLPRDPFSLEAMRERVLSNGDDWTAPPSDEPMVAPDPPLRAFGTPPAKILN